MLPFTTPNPPTFRPATSKQQADLLAALRANHQGASLMMNANDTSFVGTIDLDEREMESNLVNTIKSIPTHY